MSVNLNDRGYWNSIEQCEAAAEIESLRQQLAAALAACEANNAMLSAVRDEYVADSPDSMFQDITYALAIKPDASALKAHDAELIERCAKVAEETFGPMCQLGLDIADAVRELRKESK